MKSIKRGLVVAAVSAMTLMPTTAMGAPVKSTPTPSYIKDYLHAYHKVVSKLGVESAGRNIQLDGYRQNNGNVRIATRPELEASTGRLSALVAPTSIPTVTTSQAVTTAPVASSTAYSSGVGNSTVQCESGGNYAINTGNGYYGGYQFDSGTWDAYGDSAYGEASDAPPAVQDAAAASVPYDAWPNC